ncbi:hypothetical protein [Micromonospora sp. CV4]|uniref:hypothetical protein n=1 Tax=Micromonospora sp. CV4 TaxID=2478711 RepID=UPI000EF43E13|nr:hypothetical protein [Micromonospora sp. CV4]RLP93947.1 hypothetical protein EAD98_17300 [Micromonospora sp. CV4]
MDGRRAEDQHTLFRIRSRALRYWVSPLGQPDGKGVPFRVLLLCDRDEEAALSRQEIAWQSVTCGENRRYSRPPPAIR